MTREEFDQVSAANQEMLRRDPFGTEVQRKALEKLVKFRIRTPRHMRLEDLRLHDNADVAGRGSLAVVARTPCQTLSHSDFGHRAGHPRALGVKFQSKALGESVSMSKIRLDDDDPPVQKVHASSPVQGAIGRSSAKPAIISDFPKFLLTCDSAP